MTGTVAMYEPMGSDPISFPAGSAPASSPIPGVSLIVCSRNRPKMFQETLASILAGDTVPEEIILVDQSDELNQVLCRWETGRPCVIRYVWTQTVGLSVARNIGIKVSRYDLLAFTDDDVFVTPEWFGTLIRLLRQAGQRSAVTGKVRMSKPEKPGGFQLAVKYDTIPAVYKGRIGVDVLKPLNMAMHRSVFDEVGYFDVRLGTGSHYPSSEDNDFGYRMLEAGYEIIYSPQAVLYHRAWRSGHDFYRLNWSYGRGQGAYYAKYFSFRDPYMIRRTVEEYTRFLKTVFKKLGEEGFWTVLGDVVFLAGILSGWVEWLLTVSVRQEEDRRI